MSVISRRAGVGTLLALAVLGWGSPIARSAPYVYVTSAGLDGQLDQFDGTGGRLSPLTPPFAPAGSRTVKVVVSPDGRSVYATNRADNTISQYSLDPATGTLTPKSPATVATGAGPSGLAIRPDGRSAYVASYDDNTGEGRVSQYDIAPGSGVLTPKSPAYVPGGAGSRSFLISQNVAIGPDGKHAYVTNPGSGSVSQYDIDSAGALSFVTDVYTPGGFPVGLAISPDGKNAYVTDRYAGLVQYPIDPDTGTLMVYDPYADPPTAPAVAPTGRLPLEVAVSPNGKNAYVTNFLDDAVSQYSIDPDSGAVTPMDPATVASGVQPLGLAVSADGRSVYVADFGDSTMSQYAVDPVTGALTPRTPPTAEADGFPAGVAVAPTKVLTVVKGGAGQGVVTSSPSGISCGSTCSQQFVPGTVVTLTAAPAPGASFTGFSGEGCSGTGPCIVTVDDARSVTATFGLAPISPAGAPAGGPPPGGPTGAAPTAPGSLVDALDTVAPRILSFGMTRTTFVVSKSATSKFGVAAAFRPLGTAFLYRLSEAARARIAIARALPGRRSGGRCVAPTFALRHATRCTRFVRKGTLTRTSRRGANRVRFSGRIGTRALRPGRYRATLTATDAAHNRSRPARTAFTIVAP